MRPSVRESWNSMEPDAQATLEYAFVNGILRPMETSHHYSYTRRWFGFVIEFHHFRIGFAYFVIVLVPGFPEIVWDMALQDGMPVYPM